MPGQFSTLSRETAERLWFWTHLYRDLGHGNAGTARLEQSLANRLWPEDSTTATEIEASHAA